MLRYTKDSCKLLKTAYIRINNEILEKEPDALSILISKANDRAGCSFFFQPKLIEILDRFRSCTYFFRIIGR